jgi:outer membrane protein assembly factor BamB
MLKPGLLLIALTCLNLSAAEWTTFGHDPQRTGWAFEETILSPENVGTLKLQWSTSVKNEFYRLSALTAPVIASDVSTKNGSRSVVYVAGISGSVFALDAATGEELWTHTFKSVILPGKGGYQGTFLCPNGITATPVIDKTTSILYVIAGDGSLYGLDLGSGKVRFGPVQFVAPFSKNWSLNLVGDTIYTVLAQGCGGGLSGFYSMNLKDRHHPVIRQMLLSNTNTAGIWGRGGAVIGTNGRIYGQTADGYFDPAAGDYSNAVVAASLPDLNIVDYYLPPNWQYLRKKDLDLGATTPVFFGWKNRNLLAGGAKEGIVYLMDADALGGKDHQSTLYNSPRLGNDTGACCEGKGIWGGLSTARDQDGQTWLFVPMGGPLSESAPEFPVRHGETPHGSLIAFKVVADPRTQNPILQPAWVSGDLELPDPPIIANGVVFVLSNGENAMQKMGQDKRATENVRPAVLKALDMKTGKELYNSGDSMRGWAHFSGLALSDGRVFAVDHDSKVYAFGLPPKSVEPARPKTSSER